MTNTDIDNKKNNKKNNSTAVKIAYGSLGFFAVAFFTCFISTTAGGMGIVLAGVTGIVAVVLGLIEQNPKAWGIGLIAPGMFLFFLFLGLAMG